jgi:3-methyladenine DNA glycosylase AlkC
MADELREMFNAAYYKQLASELEKVVPAFNAKKFEHDVTKNIAALSLNQRLRNTSLVLKNHLPNNYKTSVELLFKVIPKLKTGYTNLVFPDFVGVYGHDHFDTSMEALKYFTQFGSSEFAVREFLKRDFDKTIKVMKKWSVDKNHHVRRLASEGSRPRLPWSFKLDEVIQNPSITLDILENLKTDNELYVKKSVANHLNDISKDNTQWMLDVLKTWDNTHPDTAWIKKHASRTLIKKGNTDSLALFDFEPNIKIDVTHFKLHKYKLQLGDYLQFEFDLISQKNKAQKLAVDYKVYYVKKGGELSPKVFKLKEIYLAPHQIVHIEKKHLFKDFTTRKHHQGTHYIEVIINGKNFCKTAFELKM